MTPDVIGRWQTRLFVLALAGLPITAIYSAALDRRDATLFGVLAYVAALGLAWDIGWQGLQSLRWDRDWPPVLHFAAGAVEGAFLFALAGAVRLPGLPRDGLDPQVFAAHYTSVYVAAFAFLQGPMRVLWPRWRFDAGRLVHRR